MRQGLYYNPYFAGGLIAMPPPLQDGQVEYEDGTQATISQVNPHCRSLGALLTGCCRAFADGQGRVSVPQLDCRARGG